MNRIRVLAFLGAVLLHGVLLLFGGALFVKSPHEVLREDVQLTEAVEEEEQKKPEAKKAEEEEKQEEAEETKDSDQDAVEELREAAPDTSSLALLESPASAPALSALSLSDLSSALAGVEGAGDGFGAGFSLASGGRIGGTGTASLAGDPDGGDGPAGLISIEDLDQRPRAVLQTPPSYPQELRKRKVEGSVEVVFLVDPSGRVTNPRVEKASNPAFEQPALDAVRQWRFEAGTRGGERVSFKMRVPITFRAG